MLENEEFAPDGPTYPTPAVVRTPPAPTVTVYEPDAIVKELLKTAPPAPPPPPT